VTSSTDLHHDVLSGNANLYMGVSIVECQKGAAKTFFIVMGRVMKCGARFPAVFTR
jgi:hypothetical protein